MAEPPRPDPTSGPEGPDQQLEDRPPFLSWGDIYVLVLGALGVQIVLYAVLVRVMR